jgi:hypothetical protein
MLDDDHLPGEQRRGRDRRCRRVYVFRDKRTGFDRRVRHGDGNIGVVESALMGLRDSPSVLWMLLFAINILNLADFAFTLNVLSAGGGEANPVMRGLFALGPVWAGIFKVAAVGLASWLMWRCRRFRCALKVTVIMAALFAAVLGYHLYGLVAFD